MSIVACVKVYDGIVLGAESMTQLFAATAPGQVQLVKAFSNARKLFQIATLPVGVLTYGGGNIGTRSIESFLVEFGESLPQQNSEQVTVEGLATELLKFIKSPYEKQYAAMPADKKPAIGFYLAGYSTGKHLGSEWEFVLPADQSPREAREDDQCGASWRGVAVPFTRLYFGLDPRLPDALLANGIPKDVVEKLANVAKGFISPVVFDGMPVQDAVGFCRFILDTTIELATYEIGPASCGGPLQMALVTRNSFNWVTKSDIRV